jgi:hypothetical protein
MTTDLLVATSKSKAPDIAELRRPAPGRRLWLAIAAFLLVTGSGLGYLVHDERQANTRFDVTHSLLRSTEGQLRAELAAQSDLQNAVFVLESQSTQTGASLAQTTSDLQGVEASLTNERANVAQQGTSIVGLQTCLGGVEQALNALSVGDQRSALAALGAVTSSCQSAVATGG